MGADVAVTTVNPGPFQLKGFNEVVCLKLDLRNGKWAIFGRVQLKNIDGDDQNVEAKLLHHVNVEIDRVWTYGESFGDYVMALQATLTVIELDTVVLSCNTYDGTANQASLIAIKVDDIEVQP